MKSTLSLAALAVLAAGCSSTEPDHQVAAAPSPPPSIVGPTGYTGPDGPTGPPGATGPAGYGTAGPAGAAGPQGATGQTGAQGATMAGGIGPSGGAGASGPSGSVGASGAQGPTGIVGRWASYRVIDFDYARSELSAADRSVISDVAAYMAKNPSLQVGLDGYNDPNSPRLSERRVGTVREALIAAGVPPSKIQVGAFGDPQLRTDRRVEMLLSTGSAPGSQSMKTQ